MQAGPEDRIRPPAWKPFDPFADPTLIMQMKMVNIAYQGRHTEEEIEALWKSRHQKVWEEEQQHGRMGYEVAEFDLDRDGRKERVVQAFRTECIGQWAVPGGPKLYVLEAESGRVDPRYTRGADDTNNVFFHQGLAQIGYWEVNFRWLTGQWTDPNDADAAPIEEGPRRFATFHVAEPWKPTSRAPFMQSGAVCSIGLYRKWTGNVRVKDGVFQPFKE